jgi:hypothetical protein
MPPDQQLPTLLPIEVLEGAEVSQWFGLEDALDWVEHPDDQVDSVVWQHDSIPFLQLGRVDLRLSSGATLSILGQLDGMYLAHATQDDYSYSSPTTRWRELRELPTGILRLLQVRADGPHAILEVELLVGSATVRLLAAEVEHQWDGTFRICEPDESVLVQLNGARPGL